MFASAGSRSYFEKQDLSSRYLPANIMNNNFSFGVKFIPTPPIPQPVQVGSTFIGLSRFVYWYMCFLVIIKISWIIITRQPEINSCGHESPHTIPIITIVLLLSQYCPIKHTASIHLVYSILLSHSYPNKSPFERLNPIKSPLLHGSKPTKSRFWMVKTHTDP